MWQGTRSLALVILVGCAANALASLPDWANAAMGEGLTSSDPEVKAVVILDEKKYTLGSGDEVVERHRRMVKILRKEGREEANLHCEVGPRDKLLSIHAWTRDAAGRDYELKDQDFSEKTPYSFELYEDVRFRTAVAPAPQPGSIIAFQCEVRYRTWFHELSWTFQEESPVQEARLILQMPAGWEYKDFWTRKDAVKPTVAADGNVQWTVLDIPGIKEEPRMPSYRALSDRMDLSYFTPGDLNKGWASWDAIGRWYSQLADGRRAATPEISRKAAELTAGKPDFDSRVRALATFVQSELRYVAIEIGVGGYQPHPAADIFRMRYGDCKDKATLLSSMLHEAGIESNYVIINTQRGVTKAEIPSPFFDHVILAIELPAAAQTAKYRSVVTGRTGKRYLIFDPTDEETPVGGLRAELQDNYGLLVTENGGELVRTPMLEPESNTLLREGRFVLTPDLSLQGQVVERRSGDYASEKRYRLRSVNQQERQQQEENFFNRSFQGFTMQNLEIKDLDNRDKDLVIQCQIAVPQYGKLQGPLVLLRPRVMGQKSFFVDTKPRQWPIELRGTSREIDTFEIEIPQGYKVDDVPAPLKLDAGFASYSSQIEIEGNKLKYSREYIVKELNVPAERVAELREFEGRVGADEVAAVVLVKQ